MPSLDDVLHSENQYEIEMLEIPDDTLDTGSVSDVSDSPDKKGPLPRPFNGSKGAAASDDDDSQSQSQSPSPQLNFPTLKEWLNNDSTLPFLPSSNLDHPQSSDSDFIQFSNSLFKAFESLSSVDMDDILAEEPIGLITSGDITQLPQVKLAKRTELIGQGAFDLLEVYQDYTGTLSDSEKYDYLQVTAILECLRAVCFYDNVQTVPELLCTWINRIDPVPDLSLVESVMINTPKPYLHPQFWNTYLPQLLLRGLNSQAVNAIQKSGYIELATENDTLFRIIDDLTALVGSYSTMALKLGFNEWKLKACEFRDTIATYTTKVGDISPEHVVILSQIYDITCIITGLPKTIAQFCDNWYEMFVALSLYQVRYDSSLYREYFDMAFGEKSIRTVPDQWEEACVNILQENYLKALTIIDLIDFATAAYVSRLLDLNGSLNGYYLYDADLIAMAKFGNSKTISEYLITKYAYQCLNTDGLVPIGVGLLVNPKFRQFQSGKSSTENRKIIAEFLPSMNCKTNDDLEWALTVCAQLNLPSTAQKLYLKYGQKSLKDRYLYESMNMFVNCYKPEEVNGGGSSDNNRGMKELHRISWDLIFQDSLLNSRPIHDELINNIVAKNVDTAFEVHPVIRQCLSPYAVLFEFFESLKRHDNSNGMAKCSKLMHLLRFNFLPKKYFPLLLCQFIPIFKDEFYRFLFSDLIVIIEVLNEYQLMKEEDKEAAETLLKYSLDNVEQDVASYDWRVVLEKSGEKVSSISAVIKLLRNEVSAKIGRVYIEQ